MKILILFITTLSICFQTLDLNSIRDAYKIAANDKTKVDTFHASLKHITKADAITLVAYKGAAIALMGKKAHKIKDKKSLFIEGVTLVEYAIEKEPLNIENRFIRLGIQENTPKLLKYKEKIPEDKTFLLDNYADINSSQLKKHILDYILQSKAFSDEEKELILRL
jgi:hypothetical protein